jgi:hypothetical protein
MKHIKSSGFLYDNQLRNILNIKGCVKLSSKSYNMNPILHEIKFERNRASTVIVMYSLYLFFLGLSLRNVSKVLMFFKGKQRR